MWSVPRWRRLFSVTSRMCSGRLSRPNPPARPRRPTAQVEAELGREDDVVADVLHGPSEELLVTAGAHAVQLGGVEEGDAEFVGTAEGGDAALLVRGTVGHGHAHRAEADGADLQTLGAEPAVREVPVVLCHASTLGKRHRG